MSTEMVTLIDAESGSEARILAGLGFNCFSFRAHVGGRPQEILWAAEGFESGQLKPTASGIPILFPYAGRLRGDQLDYQGRRYPQEVLDPRGNAIHGFVLRRPWRIVEQQADRVMGEFQASLEDPALLDRWPADFLIRVSYRVNGGSLLSEIIVENPDERPLPFGVGTHPYFRVPLQSVASEATAEATKCVVRVPVRNRWLLEGLMPTGEHESADATGLARGVAFGETKFDDVFGGLLSKAGRVAATIDDPASRRRLAVTFDDAFRYAVVFNPPHREAICIEPYTCLPDAYQLESRGISTGLRTLAPGERFSAKVDISLTAT